MILFRDISTMFKFVGFLTFKNEGDLLKIETF